MALYAAIAAQPLAADAAPGRLYGSTQSSEPMVSELFAAPPATPWDISAAAAAVADRWQVGIAVLDRVTGQYVDNGAPAASPMGAASLVKVLMAEELFYQNSLGLIALSAADLSRIQAMLTTSDDQAASALYDTYGGASLVQAAMDRHGMTESAASTDPSQWAFATITARDMVTFYDDFLDGSIPAADREFMLSAMRAYSPNGTDGFNQIYGLPAATDPAGVVSHLALKQGWMCCFLDARNIHSAAVFGADERYVLIILTTFGLAQSDAYGRDTVSTAAGLVLEAIPR